jgi:hypothetical protein
MTITKKNKKVKSKLYIKKSKKNKSKNIQYGKGWFNSKETKREKKKKGIEDKIKIHIGKENIDMNQISLILLPHYFILYKEVVEKQINSDQKMSQIYTIEYFINLIPTDITIPKAQQFNTIMNNLSNNELVKRDSIANIFTYIYKIIEIINSPQYSQYLNVNDVNKIIFLINVYGIYFGKISDELILFILENNVKYNISENFTKIQIQNTINKIKNNKEILEKERQKAEKLETERLETERFEAEQLKKERLAAEAEKAEEKKREEKIERLEKERQEAERLEKERLEKERLEKERLEKERQEAERLETENKINEKLIKKDTIKTIVYPYQMTYIKIKNKKILLFGEKHNISLERKEQIKFLNKISQNNEKITILDYLRDCVYKSYLKKNCIDIVIEQGFDQQQGYKLSKTISSVHTQANKSSINRLRYLFNCKLSINNLCTLEGVELDNLRVHNFDLRDFSKAGEDETDTIEFYKLIHQGVGRMVNDYIQHRECINNLVSDTNNLTLFIKYILGYDNINNYNNNNNKNYNAFIGKYINNNITELTKIKNETILTEFAGLREKMQKSYNKFKITQNQIIPEKKDVRDILLNYYIINYVDVDLKKRSGIFLTVFTDLYLIIRLLQKFDTEKMKRGPKQCQETDSLDKVCVYAGGFHINIVKDIFILLFGEDIIHYSNNNKEEKNYEEEINFSDSISNKGNFKDFSDIMNDFTENSESVV